MIYWIQRHGATWLLLCMGLVFLLAYPFHEDPLGGLITHISGAAMIGGLADWYAVTALFAKPLGIPYKTAIIPRNRERFVEMARHMVVDELLRVPHMYEVIKQEDVPQRILRYMDSDQGHQYMHVFFEELGDHVMPHLDSSLWRDQLLDRIGDGFSTWKITPFLLSLGTQLLQKERAHIIWLYINRMLQRILSSEGIRPYLLSMVASILDRYAHHSFFRELALALGGESLSPPYLVDLIRLKGRMYLQSQESLDSNLGRLAYEKAQSLLVELSRNEQWQKTIEEKKNGWFQNFLEDGTILHDTNDMALYVKRGEEELQRLLHRLVTDEGKRRKAERYILFHLVKVLEKVRPFIESSVLKEMNRYSGEDITRLLRSKLGYDLQMIRINGSLVGAVLGGLFYGLQWLLKGGV